MTLSEALAHVFDSNARITRRIWHNPKIYCSAVAQMLCITGVNADGKPHPWTITESDYYADDWEVVE